MTQIDADEDLAQAPSYLGNLRIYFDIGTRSLGR